MAKFRTNLIRNELNRRKLNSSLDLNDQNMNEEEKQLAKLTKLSDPFNKKISNLTLKARQNWFNKMVQVLEENSKGKMENKESDLCIEFEHEILIKSKNLSIYQANCMRKISEIKKFTKENKYFIDYYNQQKKINLESKNDDEELNSLTKSDQISSFTKDNEQITGNIKTISSTFKTALSFYNDQIVSSNNDLALIKTESEEVKVEAKFTINEEKNQASTTEMVNRNSSHEATIYPTFENHSSSANFSGIESETKNESQKNLTLNEISMIIIPELSKIYKEGKFQSKVSKIKFEIRILHKESTVFYTFFLFKGNFQKGGQENCSLSSDEKNQ